MDIGMIGVFFVYGLAFFILGISTFLYPKKSSSYKFANDLWLIGAFGILHGINEWIDMFILIQKPLEMMPLKIIRMAILPVSFLFLIYFGTKTIADTKKEYSTLKALPAILFIVWGIITTLSHNRFLMGDIWARYLLAIPGVLLTSYALTLQIPEFKKTHIPEVIVNLKFAAGAFFFYALFSGFVPQADFFPASFFNYTVFLDIVGIPVQVFRTLIAITMTYSVIQVLGIFELETLKTVQNAHDKLKSDITELKQAKEALKTSEEKYSLLVEKGNDGIIIIQDGLLKFSNSKMIELTGFSYKEAVGKPFIDFISPEYKERVMERYKKRLKGEKIPSKYEIEILSKKGTRIHVEINASLIEYEGRPAAMAIIRDITERKRAEEERLLLQKVNNMLNAGVDQEEVFKTLVDGLRSLYNYESVAIHLICKDKTCLIVKGYSADSKVAKRLEKLTGLTVMDYKVAFYEGSLFQEVIDTGKPVIANDIKWVLNSYGGKKYPQSLIKIAAKLTKAKWGIGMPLLAGDKLVGVIGCGSTYKLTDKDSQRFAVFGAQAGLAIERAQTFEALEKAYDELKQSNKLKDLFIDIMKHDLLNPAGSTRNLTEMLSEEEKDSDKIESFQVILRNTERIIEMIENASKLAVLESGKELEFEEKDLGQILKSVAEGMTSLADEKKMTIKTNIKGKFKALVNPLVYDVFSNLLDNAIKYGDRNSDVIVKIKEDGSNWKISVSDNGEGIPNEDKKAIFNRFKRIEKGAVQGSGLGLAIVKRVVNAHKGRAWVEDNPGGGSIFFVLLKKA